MKEYSTILEPDTRLSNKASIHARLWMIIALVMTDFASLVLAFSLAVLLRIRHIRLDTTQPFLFPMAGFGVDHSCFRLARLIFHSWLEPGG